MDETREKRITLLVGVEVIDRKQYDKKGLKLTFQDALTQEKYYRTLYLTKKEGPTLIRYFLKVILDDSNKTNQLLENPNELVKACKLNDHKFFSLDLNYSVKTMKNGKPFKNVIAISEHQATFDEKMLYIEKGMINLETEKGIADLEM